MYKALLNHKTKTKKWNLLITKIINYFSQHEKLFVFLIIKDCIYIIRDLKGDQAMKNVFRYPIVFMRMLVIYL
jgi:hypothetical protein